MVQCSIYMCTKSRNVAKNEWNWVWKLKCNIFIHKFSLSFLIYAYFFLFSSLELFQLFFSIQSVFFLYFSKSIYFLINSYYCLVNVAYLIAVCKLHHSIFWTQILEEKIRPVWFNYQRFQLRKKNCLAEIFFGKKLSHYILWWKKGEREKERVFLESSDKLVIKFKLTYGVFVVDFFSNIDAYLIKIASGFL